MHIVFERAEPLAPDILSFWFRPERPVQYVPGQFADFYLPHDGVDARGASRQFSFTSLPAEPLLSIAVRFPQNCSSYKQALRSMTPGTQLHLGEPLGDFVLPKLANVPMVWVAGGVGSAAFASMAKELAASQEQRHVTLLQSARHSSELLYTPLWDHAGLAIERTVTGPDNSWTGRRSRFSIDDILDAAQGPHQTLFYISGSEQMVDDICAALIARDIRSDQLVREAFAGY